MQASKRSLAAVDRPIEDASCPDSEPGCAGRRLPLPAAGTQTGSWERLPPACLPAACPTLPLLAHTLLCLLTP